MTAVGRTLAALAALVAVAGMAVPGVAHHGKESPFAPDMVLGDPKAPIKIVEYASLTCSHCATFHNDVLPRLKANYIDTGKARLVYRDFPFDQGALFAAAVARCAGPDRYFGFIEVLFRTQTTWAAAADTVEALARIGRLGGMKRAAIDACVANQGLLDSILASRVTGATEFNVTSTPTFIINGEKLVGAQPYERFEEILERMLAKS